MNEWMIGVEESQAWNLSFSPISHSHSLVLHKMPPGIHGCVPAPPGELSCWSGCRNCLKSSAHHISSRFYCQMFRKFPSPMFRHVAWHLYNTISSEIHLAQTCVKYRLQRSVVAVYFHLSMCFTLEPHCSILPQMIFLWKVNFLTPNCAMFDRTIMGVV